VLAQGPHAFAAQITVDTERDPIRSLQGIDLDGESQRHPDGCAHDDLRSTARSQLVPDGFGRGKSRPPLRPLIHPFENSPDSVDVGVDAPPIVEMEG
jgi:hypothetical protein